MQEAQSTALAAANSGTDSQFPNSRSFMAACRLGVSVPEFHRTFHRVKEEVAGVVIGQDRVVEQLLAAIFAGGHVLLRGMPGLGRTLLVKTLARVLGLEYRRIQFTPDLLPTDIVGTEVLECNTQTGDRHFRFFKGPVFANLVLADEINRSPTRTQNTLLEVMQERQVTVGGHTYPLPQPFFMIATENSQDTAGVFHLGEAQVDRFLMMIEQEYPDSAGEKQMALQTTGTHRPEAQPVCCPQDILAMQALAREVPVVPVVRDFALAIVRASRPGEADSVPEARGLLRLGASPRAAQALLLAAKVIALARGRQHVAKQDVIAIARPVMAHRLLVDYRAQAEGQDAARVLELLIARAEERHLPRVSLWTQELLTLGESRKTGEQP